jgi:predicted nucleic acid-binding protein
MSPIKTYLDSNVLIGAALGNQIASKRALEILDDENRIFVSSHFVKMEILPTPMKKKDKNEEEFYQLFFSRVTTWAVNLDRIIDDAIGLAGNSGVKILDACHIMAAISLQADEFVTAEAVNSPVLKAPGIKTISIQP